jgi:hypothetical protein
LILSGLAASAALCAMPATAHAQIFATNFSGNTIWRIYDFRGDGEPLSGVSGPTGIAVSGGDLFVVNADADGTIREYTISGAIDSVDESTTR